MFLQNSFHHKTGRKSCDLEAYRAMSFGKVRSSKISCQHDRCDTWTGESPSLVACCKASAPWEICNAARHRSRKKRGNEPNQATVNHRRLWLSILMCDVVQSQKQSCGSAAWPASANRDGSSQGMIRKAYMKCRSAMRCLFISVSFLLRTLLSSLTLLSRLSLRTHAARARVAPQFASTVTFALALRR